MIDAYFEQVWASVGERLGKTGEVWTEEVGETWTGQAGENGDDIGILGSLRSRRDRDVWTPGIVQVPSAVAYEDEAIRRRNGGVYPSGRVRDTGRGRPVERCSGCG